MRIISRPPILEFKKKYPAASVPLSDWYEKTKMAKCANLNELKDIFVSCDYIGNDRYVFNLGGNNFRLVAMINFIRQCLYIRAILTHAEYDKHNDKNTLVGL